MENATNHGKSGTAITVVAILATFLLMVFLVRQMTNATQPPGIDAARVAERINETAKVRAESAEAAKHWGNVDPAKGIVRLPLDEAMKITVQGYQQPAAFRSNLLMRADKLFPPPVNYE